jgi:hypothetical protein
VTLNYRFYAEIHSSLESADPPARRRAPDSISRKRRQGRAKSRDLRMIQRSLNAKDAKDAKEENPTADEYVTPIV